MDRFFIDERDDKFAYITDKEEVKHISKILRMKVGAEVEIIDGKGYFATGEITEIRTDKITILTSEATSRTSELNTKIRVYQGIPKSQKMDFIVQKLTEIGVSDIYPVAFDRCVKNISEKEEKQIQRWTKIAIEATKQSKRLLVSKVHNSLDLHSLADAMKDNDYTLVCFENEDENSFKNFFKGIDNLDNNLKIGLIIGPEGGLEDYEVEFLKEKGAISISLTQTILRTETASIFAASVIAYELG